MTGAGEGPRVLFVSGLQIHPPVSGGNLRSYALAGALARRGLEVSVYSMAGRKPDYLARRPSGTQAWPDGIPERVDRSAAGFVAQYGSYALRLPPVWLTAWLRAGAASPGEALLPAGLRRRLAWCEAVVADFPFVHPVFSAPSARGRLRVLSTHNLEHRMFDGRGARSRFLRALVRRLELRAAEACDVLVSCCRGDQEFFEAHARGPRHILVPNAIDRRRFQDLERRRGAARRALGLGDGVKAFLFTASKYGPNREALDVLLDLARREGPRLSAEGIHLLVVGNVTREPLARPGLTVTGPVEAVEPFFAAADAALNPITAGTGTNVKMCEFLAAGLPILTTSFGARGFDLEDGRTAFLFEREGLLAVLSRVRRLFDEQPDRLRRMAADAYARNEHAIDMDACVGPLVAALRAGARPRREREAAPVLDPEPSSTGSGS